MDLFKFNDDFIAAAACGMSEEDTLEMFAESIRAGAEVLEERLLKVGGPELVSQTQFVNGAFEIPMSEEQFDKEFGGESGPPQADIRRALIGASIPATMAMTKALNGD